MDLTEHQAQILVYFFGIFDRPKVGVICFSATKDDKDINALCSKGLIKEIGRTYDDNHSVFRLQGKGLKILDKIAAFEYPEWQVYCSWK